MDAIEQRLVAASPLVGRAWVIGAGRPYLTALLALDAGGATAFADEYDIPELSGAELAEDELLRSRVAEAVDSVNAELDPGRRIRRFTILPAEPAQAPAGDAPVAEAYAAEIEAMYL